MEAALVNVLSPGDAMLALVAGNFGERWAALGRAHGMDVRTLEAPLGRGGAAERGRRGAGAGPADPRRLRPALRVLDGRRATTCEALARITRERARHAAGGGRHLGRGRDAARDARPGAWTWWWWAARRRWRCRRASPSCRCQRAGVGARGSRRDAALLLRPAARAQGAGRGRGGLHAGDLATWWRSSAALDALEARGGVDALVANAATLAAMTRAAAAALGLPLLAPRAPRRRADGARGRRRAWRRAPIVKALKSEFGSTVAGGQGRSRAGSCASRTSATTTRPTSSGCWAAWRSCCGAWATASSWAAAWPPPRPSTSTRGGGGA